MTEQLNNEIVEDVVVDMEAVEDAIEELAESYQEFSDIQKKGEAGKKSASESIKAILAKNKLTTVDMDSFKVSLQERVRSSMNEGKLLERLKNLGLTQCIKTVEQIDSDELEKLIYSGDVNPEDIADCEDSSVSYVLSVRKKKSKAPLLSKKVQG